MIRAAAPADAAAIARLEPGWTAAMLAETLSSPTTVAFVHDDPLSHAIIGHVLATAVADTGEIVLIAVDPAARRGGIGRALLRRIVDVWFERGIVDGWLEVRADNGAAIALYQSEGWRETGIRRRYYRDGTDAIAMNRVIARSR